MIPNFPIEFLKSISDLEIVESEEDQPDPCG